MTRIQLKTGGEMCEVVLRNGLLSSCGKHVADAVRGRCAVVVTDTNCKELYGGLVMSSLDKHGFSSVLIALPAGETSKSLPMLTTLYSVFASVELSSVDAVIALGGGVVCDIAGMAAATYLQGVPFIAMPTTMVSQISSSIGGKVAIDLSEGKNLIGLYYQPRLVLVDPTTLSTLDSRGISNGISELVRYAAAVDSALFEHLEKQRDLMLHNLISRCLHSKASFLEADLRERGARHFLNFGTTLGYAYERLRGLMSDSYGHALAAGMAQMAKIGMALDVTPPSVYERLCALFSAHNLPTEMHYDPALVFKATMLDKKRYGGTFNLVLLKDIGQPLIHPVSTEKFFTLIKNLT